MTTIAASVEVDAPPEATWAVLTDWTAQGSWMPMTKVEVTGGDGALGTEMTARSGLGRLALIDPMTIDVWEPPHRCEVAHHGRVITGRGVFVVDELPGGRSKVTWEEQLAGTGVMSLLDRASVPGTRVMLGVALKRLKRAVTASP
jgi:carbon monoxide dehydrogenase subunit G